MNAPRRRIGPACLLVLAAAAACAGSSGLRSGADFDDEFPDAAELVTTSEPAAVRQRLAQARLPATPEHHERLVALLHAQSSISVDHLVLLVEAVALASPTNIVFVGGGRLRAYPTRGESEYAAVADELLTIGADKLGAVDARGLGELVALTQSDAVLVQIADRFLPQADDGSEAALVAMLDGMHGSPAAAPFVCICLAPRGRVDGAQGWTAVRHVAFDSDRLAIIDALAARSDNVDGRLLVVAMEALSFDNARRQGLQALADKAGPVSADVGREVIAAFSFDEGRGTALATLASGGHLEIDDAQLAQFCGLFSFDSGRLRCVQTLAQHVRGEPSFAAADALLRGFSFDSGRLATVELMAPRWLTLPTDDRARLAKCFWLDSARADALRLLMK